MSKQYGLIIPGKEKKPAIVPKPNLSRPSIFGESSSSDSDDNGGPPKLMMKTAPLPAPGLMERRMARSVQEKALQEDPTVFQYDELYDEIENKREAEKEIKSKEPKKARYINRLLETAEKRKLENELRVERQVQKDREKEGEEFKDKEQFVTAAYRKKLEEMRKLEEQEKRDEYLESIGDVTKQKDLDGFYRHLYEQRMGTTKEIEKPVLPHTSAGDEEGVSYKPIKSGRSQQQHRAYRKRHSSDDEDTAKAKTPEPKKVHLQNNIDADSDFSIDDSSCSDEDENRENSKSNVNEQKVGKTTTIESSEIDGLKSDKIENVVEDKESKANSKDIKESLPTPPTTSANELPAKPKIDKTLIWKKRTVGTVFDAAVQRFYERKAARSV